MLPLLLPLVDAPKCCELPKPAGVNCLRPVSFRGYPPALPFCDDGYQLYDREYDPFFDPDDPECKEFKLANIPGCLIEISVDEEPPEMSV